jgi:type IV pilus assembly protein PilW
MQPLCATASPPCSAAYTADATVLQVASTDYFIASNVAQQPALFRKEGVGLNTVRNGLQKAREELVEGVEDMQVYYGEDTDGDGVVNRYVTATAMDNSCSTSPDCWNNVASVRISLLLRTLEDDIAQAPQTYRYDGTTVTANDRRLRRVFTTVVAVRGYRP